MNTYHKLAAAITVLAAAPLLAQAQFKALVGIPGIPESGAGLADYLNALYALAISLAALLAVVKIVIAGAKYMLSDVVTSKEEAKNDIRGALLGLLIVAGAWLILYTINPQILTCNVFYGNTECAGLRTAETERVRPPAPRTYSGEGLRKG